MASASTEGAEQQAIAGMNRTIQRARTVCIACHDFRANRGESAEFRTKAVVTEFLRDHGFTIALRADDGRDWVRDHIHAQRGASRFNTRDSAAD